VNSAPTRSIGKRLLAHPTARVALTIIALFVVGALVGPLVWKFGPNDQLDIAQLSNAHPSLTHPLGTDSLSRDLLARLLSGARISLAVATLAVILSTTLGTAYGLVAGYVGGRIDTAMMRLLDGFMSIPRVLLLLAVLTLWSNIPLGGLIALLGLTGWFGVSRLVRAETLAAKRQEYVDAARALGVPTSRILWRHLLPNVAAPMLVSATLSVGNVIALEAGLSYLGIGAKPPTASWGSIFYEGVSEAGAQFLATNWWVALFPGIAIVATVLAFNMLGDALRDVADPRQVHVARRLPESASLDSTDTALQPSENG
jgi:peptide/nickel transport system permease protein